MLSTNERWLLARMTGPCFGTDLGAGDRRAVDHPHQRAQDAADDAVERTLPHGRCGDGVGLDLAHHTTVGPSACRRAEYAVARSPRRETGRIAPGCGRMVGMDVPGDGELIELEEAGARVLVLGGQRRQPAADTVLRSLIADASGVPADDVELVHDVRGVRRTARARQRRVSAHRVGRVVVRGRRRLGRRGRRGGGDAASARGRHGGRHARRGVGDRRGGVPRERARRARRARRVTRGRSCGRRCGRARPRCSARSATPTSSSRRGSRCPSPARTAASGRIVRSVPEFGSVWRQVRFHDVPVPGNRAASVAVLG